MASGTICSSARRRFRRPSRPPPRPSDRPPPPVRWAVAAALPPPWVPGIAPMSSVVLFGPSSLMSGLAAFPTSCCPRSYPPSVTAGPRGRRRPRPPAGRARRQPGVLPHPRQVGGGDDRVGREAVDLRLVEQQEERPCAAHAAVGVLGVELGAHDAGRLQVGHPLLGALAELVDVTELDRLRRAGLGAGGRLVVEQAVVAERALLGHAVVLDLRRRPWAASPRSGGR